MTDPHDARRAAVYAARAARDMAVISSDGRRSGLIDLDRAERNMPRFHPEELFLGDLLGQGGFSDVYEVTGIRLLDAKEEENEANEEKRRDPRHVDAEYEEPAHTRCRHGLFRRDVLSMKGGKQRRGSSSRTVATSVESLSFHSSPPGTVHGGISCIRYSTDQQRKRSFIAKHCLRDKTDNLGIMEARYAVKFLSATTLSDRKALRTGAADLAVETNFLANLSHPHIVRLRGVSTWGYEGFASGTQMGYFLMLDRLYGTLSDRMDEWRHKLHRRDSKLGKFVQRKFLDKGGSKRRMILAQRIKVAFDVCAALVYLHSHNIVYRDIKPDNVGFDVRGDVKIFDLGLAKEIRPDDEYPEGSGTYQLSGHTGSLRYMAPEVARFLPYNQLADVYSFSIMLWEIMSLEIPYSGMSRREHSERVVYGTDRPRIDQSRVPCYLLRDLLRKGWHGNAAERPGMGLVYETLQTELKAMRMVDDKGPLWDSGDDCHARRRSTFTMSSLPNDVRQQLIDAAGDDDDARQGFRSSSGEVVCCDQNFFEKQVPQRRPSALHRVTRNATAA